MKPRQILRIPSLSLLAFLALQAGVEPASGQGGEHTQHAAQSCTPEQREEALRALQSAVLGAVPERVESLEAAVRPGGELTGWRLSHGLVVLAGSGGVAVDNIAAQEPTPQLLIYAPSPSSSTTDWLDFDGDDGPYTLAGWAYLAPYTDGSTPPARPCIEPSEWFVHEAGWHLMDGGMELTEGAEAEPAAPSGSGGYFWHPRGWDIHFWRGEEGVPTVAFHNPSGRQGGLALPEKAFFHVVDGRHLPVPPAPGG